MRVARNGDLLGATYVEATFSGGTSGAVPTYVPRAGFFAIRSAELRIGGQKIDRHSGVWMDVWSELTSSWDKRKTLDGLVGSRTQGAVTGGRAIVTGLQNGVAGEERANIPLQFSFCRNPGLALPLVALQYHEVELLIEFNTKAQVCHY